MILCSLSKETFAILIPGIIFLYIWLYNIQYNISTKESIKKNYSFILFFIIYYTSILIFLVFVVGANKQGYAGLEIKNFVQDFVNGVLLKLFTEPLLIIISVGIIIISIFEVKWKNNIILKLKDNFLYITVFFLLITVPQCIVYLKSGFVDRYYLPYILGFSFFLIYTVKKLFQEKKIQKYVKYGYLTLVFAFLIFEIKEKAISPLKTFAQDCKINSNMVNAIVQNIGNDELLMVMDPVQNFHEVFSLKTYLNHLKGVGQYKYDFIKANYISKYFADTADYNEGMVYAFEELGNNLIDSINNDLDIKNIFVFSHLNDRFVKKAANWFDASKYRKETFGRFILYFKKD